MKPFSIKIKIALGKNGVPADCTPFVNICLLTKLKNSYHFFC